MKISMTLGFDKILIMPPAYYKYDDNEVIDFYSKIANELKEAKIILYNFEKLSGYKFSVDCIKKLVSKFPQQIVGVKDSSYNLYENLKIDNFSIMPGSESKLFRLSKRLNGSLKLLSHFPLFLAQLAAFFAW